MNTQALLTEHAARYPKLQIGDLLKFLHQSAFGCEHLIASPQAAADYLKKEYEALSPAPASIEPLDGDYARVPLSLMREGLSAETFAKLFALSAKTEEEGTQKLQEKLQVATALVRAGKLPFKTEEWEAAVGQWKAEGYPALHHSEEFRQAYHPSYRVIAKKYLPFLPLLIRLDHLPRGIVAIEGGSASGKTTLGGLLEQLYDCTLLHMDDFFLPLEKRTPERFAEAGGNVDYERFLEEVLQPASQGKSFLYRRFDCSTMTVGEGQEITPKPLIIVEGAYSLHPALAPYYHLSALLRIDPALQRQRILRRNTPAMAKRFFEEWIPLENAYFEQTAIRERCDEEIWIKE